MKKIYARIASIIMITLLVSVTASAQKKVMYVISSADLESTGYQSELDINDSLLTWDYIVDPWSSADISAGGLEAFYPDYDAIVISEWVGSSSVNNIAADNYQLPIVCFEGYAPRDGRWNWISDNDNMFNQASGDAVDADVMIMQITATTLPRTTTRGMRSYGATGP